MQSGGVAQQLPSEPKGTGVAFRQEYAEGHPEAAMNAALLGLQPGESVQVKGPFGSFRYQPGKYKAIGARRRLPSSFPPFLQCVTPAPCACLSVSIWQQ
jgi:hypothetical protein